MNKIELQLMDGVWYAKHTGPIADELVELFGTAIIPTPFLAAMPYEDVVREIKSRNMECDVK